MHRYTSRRDFWTLHVTSGPVTMVWHVLVLRMDGTTSRYGR